MKSRSKNRPSAKTELGRRSRKEWIARGVLASGLLVLGFLGTMNSLSQAVAKADAESAHTLASGDGVILAQLAEDVFSRAPDTAPDSRPARLAKAALLADPTAVKALTILAFQAQLRGDVEQSNRLFSYSTRLSRRELRPRIWAIEDAVTRGDIAGALRNYDIALRTSRNAESVLFPTLAAAMAEPRIRAELLKVLSTEPGWKDKFVTFAANSGIEPEGTIALLDEGRKIGLKATEELKVNLVNALVSQGKPDEAWTFYRTFRTAAQRNQSRDANFTLQTEYRSVFDWRAGDDLRIASAFLREGEDGLLDISVPPTVAGVLASQQQILPPGTYRLEGQSAGIQQPERSQPYWTLACQGGEDLGRVRVPESNQNGGHFSGQFTVPHGCKLQTLSLVAQSTDDIMGVTGQIKRVQLTPVQREQSN